MKLVRVAVGGAVLLAALTACGGSGGAAGAGTGPSGAVTADSSASGSPLDSRNARYEREQKAWGDAEYDVKQAFWAVGLDAMPSDPLEPGGCALAMNVSYEESQRSKVASAIAGLTDDGWVPVPGKPAGTRYAKGDRTLSVGPEHDADEPDSPVQSNQPLRYINIQLTASPCS